jgi:hypothetical protein
LGERSALKIATLESGWSHNQNLSFRRPFNPQLIVSPAEIEEPVGILSPRSRKPQDQRLHLFVRDLE